LFFLFFFVCLFLITFILLYLHPLFFSLLICYHAFSHLSLKLEQTFCLKLFISLIHGASKAPRSESFPTKGTKENVRQGINLRSMFAFGVGFHNDSCFAFFYYFDLDLVLEYGILNFCCWLFFYINFSYLTKYWILFS